MNLPNATEWGFMPPILTASGGVFYIHRRTGTMLAFELDYLLDDANTAYTSWVYHILSSIEHSVH